MAWHPCRVRVRERGAAGEVGAQADSRVTPGARYRQAELGLYSPPRRDGGERIGEGTLSMKNGLLVNARANEGYSLPSPTQSRAFKAASQGVSTLSLKRAEGGEPVFLNGLYPTLPRIPEW